MSLLLLFAGFIIQAQSPIELFEEGNLAYKEGDYSMAITLYDSLYQMEFQSAELEYNFGNAYFKDDKLAEAILHYERALKLIPNDEDLLHNLKVVNARTIDRFEQIPKPLLASFYQGFVSMLSSNGWAMVAIAMFFIMCFGSYLYVYSDKKRRGFIVAMVSLGLGLIFLGIAQNSSTAIENEKFAILGTANSYVKSAPSLNSEDLFILHEGSKTQVLDELEDWKKIKLIDGKIGWIPSDQLLEI